ncbi:IS66 family insertion sequence element accessory protein TnpB [Candidatus Glomeribacter gigasporarum]|uniref:IS66 family insertion sequence element accessory protein TnpB n=1 Tax=Candidatus Glomeribacter gigasporarum TaxID=132144 RepID=UPI001EF0D765|nr:IS66 family insertion sequence element accessory protein TnpB [Candidatus Glomeribacter gigasporarum]
MKRWGAAMFHLAVDLQVYLHREAVDFRKGINGLAALVEQSLQRDPFARAVYAFSNRRRDRVKLLLWDRNGFWLLTKRLEADRFMWPRQQAVLVLTIEQLHWLLEGIDIEAMRRHPWRAYRRVS